MKIWLFAFVIPSMAFAFPPTSQQKCSSIDLRNETLGNVRNQHNISWCYAFTGADMLAHEYNINEKISAADVAIGYNQSKIALFIRWLDLNILNRKDPVLRYMSHQNGFNKIALKHAMKDGWCPESVFPSEVWPKMSRTERGWEQSQVPLDQAMIEIAALHEKNKFLTAENIPYYFNLKNIDLATFIEILQTKKMAHIYSSVRQTVCRNDRHPFEDQRKIKMVFKNSEIFPTIGTQLENGQLVGLDYDARILKDSNNTGFEFRDLHTSSLVGRRWNAEKNVCEYLIRNSWGNACGNRYDPSYECIAGNVWLNESQMYRSMTSIVYMQSSAARD